MNLGFTFHLIVTFGNEEMYCAVERRQYLLGLPIFISVLLLPHLMNYIRNVLNLVGFKIKDGNLQRCIYVAIVYWIFSGLSWLVGRLDFLYLAAFLAIGGFYSVEGVWKTQLRPKFLDNRNLTLEAKVELIKYEDNKWWRGLNLL